MKDFALTIFVVSSVLLVFAVLFIPFDSNSALPSIPSQVSSDDFVGFASYPGYANPVSSIVVDNNLIFNSLSDVVSKSIDISDDIIYRLAYVSFDDSSWSPFNLTPSGSGTIIGEWIYGRGISSISFSPSILHLNNTRTVSNNTFIIIYSCSKNTTLKAWDCHSGWQILQFNAILNSQGSGSSLPFTWTDELMTNGGFESGNLNGWTAINGVYGQGFNVANHIINTVYALPQSGNYLAYFIGGTSNASGVDFYIYQDVDLNSYAGYIDAGTAIINASGWGATSEYLPYGLDTTRIQIIFLDSSKNIIQTAADSGNVRAIDSTWWQKSISNYVIPVGARYIRMRATSFEPDGVKYDGSGSLDSFSVKVGYGGTGGTIVNPPVCTPSCSGKQCGSDGCSGTCGSCISIQTCTNSVCVNNVVTPTCSDGIQNQGETGVDCGGPCTACSSTGPIYYISTTGNDTASGSFNSPWKTLAHACSAVTTSGAVIHVNQGTFVEKSQCYLNVGVSIEGEGTGSIIKSQVTGSTYSNSFTIMLVSSSTTNGRQHISNLKMDGDSLTAYGAIYVEKRSRVEISHCTFVHFFYYGVGFEGGNTESGGFIYPPTIYPNNNSIHDCVIDDCSAYYPENAKNTGEGKGAIIVDGQEGMLIYNNILTQTSRPAGNNGYLIKGVTGLNKGLKIFNNTIVKAPYDGTTWDFAIELWLNRGGVEIYDNDITGSVDISGSSGELTAATQKTGSYTYGVYIHDNYIHQTNSESSEGIRGILIEQSAEDVIIAKNHITGVAEGIYCPLGYAGGNTFKNINISYNIIENLDGPNWQTWGMLIENPGGYTADNINIYNNVITARENGLTTMYGIEVPIVGTTTNVNIKNNIVEGFDHEPIYASGSSGETLKNLIISNNIFYKNGNNNQPLFSGITPNPYTYQNNQEGIDPKFVDAANGNYHLQYNSPAINAGVNVGLTSDYDGNPVPYPAGGATDIGAYEYR